MANPTVPPAAVPPPDPVAARGIARDRHRRELDALLDYTPLPHASITPTPAEVIVTVGRLDDLADWAVALGGTPEMSPTWEGTETWVLHTTIPMREEGRRLRVRVAALSPVGAPVPEVLEGASRLRPYGQDGATGPCPVYVGRRPVGAVLDVSVWMERVLAGLAELYAEDPEEMGERLAALLEEPPHLPEEDSEMTRLIKDIGAERLYIERPGRLGAHLAQLASPLERAEMEQAGRPIAPSNPGVAA